MKQVNRVMFVMTAFMLASGAPRALAGGINLGQLLDATTDVVTLGEHGRQRDRERARQAEATSQAVREGAAKAYAEKVNGLKRSIADATMDLQRWEDFAQRFPLIMQMQEWLIDQMQTKLANQSWLTAYLKSAFQTNQEQAKALQIITDAIKNAPVGNPSDDNAAAMQAWDAAMQAVESIAQNSGLSVEAFLNKAIAESDADSLNELLVQTAGLHGQLVSMYAVVQRNIGNARQVKIDYEAELYRLEHNGEEMPAVNNSFMGLGKKR